MTQDKSKPLETDAQGNSITPPHVSRSRLRIKDAISEAGVSTIGRPGRTILTALGTILGVAAVVATIGIVSTARNQISDSFNAETSTQVTVADLGVGNIPLRAEKTVLAIRGVASAGISWQVNQSVTVASNPDPKSADQFSQTVPLYAATPEGLQTTGVHVVQGRTFDQGNEARKDHVALLGSVAAASLGIVTTVNSPAVFINGMPFTVVGIIDQSNRQPGALTGVTIPASTALALSPLPQISAAAFSESSESSLGHGPSLYINTNLGAAQVVGRQLSYTIAPTGPSNLSVSIPADPRTLRKSVEGTTGSLVLLLAGLSIIIGMVAIANTTLLAVIERAPEIGLRRALGARPRHIAAATLLEAAFVGGVGGAIGAVLGVFATTGTALHNQWTAVIDIRIVFAAPFAGMITGFLAGLYPAYRSTKVEPATALQRM